MHRRQVSVEIRAFTRQHDAVLLPRVTQMGDDHLQVGKVHGDILQLQRQAPLEPRLAGEGRALMPHDGQPQLLGLGKERPMLAVAGVKVLIGRPQLQPAQPQILDAVHQLFNAVRLVGVHRRPAFQLFRVLLHIIRNQLIGHPNARGFGLQPKDHHPIRRFRYLPVILRLGVIGVQVQPSGIGLPPRHLELDQLGGQRLLGVLLTHMVGIPHEMGVTIHNAGLFRGHRQLLGRFMDTRTWQTVRWQTVRWQTVRRHKPPTQRAAYARPPRKRVMTLAVMREMWGSTKIDAL